MFLSFLFLVKCAPQYILYIKKDKDLRLRFLCSCYSALAFSSSSTFFFTCSSFSAAFSACFSAFFCASISSVSLIFFLTSHPLLWNLSKVKTPKLPIRIPRKFSANMMR